MTSGPIPSSTTNAPAGSLKVEVWTDAASWDAYVQQAPAASNYHQWGWKAVIEETFGHRTHYLAAIEGGRIRGVLPLVEMKSFLFGHFLVSMPFFNYGGVLADTREVQDELFAKVGEIAGTKGAKHVELRQGDALATSWELSTAKVAMVVPVNKPPAEIMAKLASRLRNKIRHAQKHGLEVRWGGAEAVEEFYPVFAENMRNLGTPVYSKSLFANVFRHFPQQTRIMTVRDNNRPVAATLVTAFRKFVELPWIASTAEARKHYSTYLLYWTALEWASQNGYDAVDLGRCTPGGGTHQFKQQWNAQEVPLHWYYWLAPGVPMPHLRPDNPKYKLAISVWQRLPLWLVNRIGPPIVRSIP